MPTALTQFLIVRDFIHRVTRSWRGRIYSLRRGTPGISRCSCMAKSPAASLDSPLRGTTCRLTGFALDAGCPQLSFPSLASAASFWIEWVGSRECYRQRPCQFGIADRALRTRGHISTLAMLFQLRALAERIAMDELVRIGTGYSWLSYPQCFPFDKIKIDRSV